MGGQQQKSKQIKDTDQTAFEPESWFKGSFIRIEGSIFCFGNHLLAKVLRHWIGVIGGKGVSIFIGQTERSQITMHRHIWAFLGRKLGRRQLQCSSWNAASVGRLGLVIVY